MMDRTKLSKRSYDEENVLYKKEVSITIFSVSNIYLFLPLTCSYILSWSPGCILPGHLSTYDRIFDKNSLSSIHTRITKNTLFIFLMACLMIAICCLRQRKRNVKDIADYNLSSRSHFNIFGSSQITYLNYQLQLR